MLKVCNFESLIFYIKGKFEIKLFRDLRVDRMDPQSTLFPSCFLHDLVDPTTDLYRIIDFRSREILGS